MKREFHIFTLTDYEKEEVYLRDMHKKGWKLHHVTLPGFYHFTEAEPEDVVYRLDFNPDSNEDKDAYTQLFADYGWEYLQDMNDYSYFRKPCEEGDMNREIFSDDKSRLDMLGRIFRRRMIPVLVIFMLVYCPQFFRVLAGPVYDPAYPYLVGFMSLFFLLYLYLFIHMGIGFWRLNKKYNHTDE